MTRDGQRSGKEKIIMEAIRYTKSYKQRVSINLNAYCCTLTSVAQMKYFNL